MNFTEKLKTSIFSSEGVLCVGLDPIPERFPSFITDKLGYTSEALLVYCKILIEETAPFAAAFKPNLGFFEAYGSSGIEVFEQVLSHIPSDKIIVADAKRGDIGNTATRYRDAFLKNWRCDSVTLSPMMGFETITPYLTEERFGTYILTLTSNPGSADFMSKPFDGFNTMSEYIAANLADLTDRFPGHAGMVVGATHASELDAILKLHPSSNLLIPGVGAQGGSIQKLADALHDHRGLPLVNVSRAIMYGDEPDTSNEVLVREGIRIRAQKYQMELLPIYNRIKSSS